LLEFAAAGLFAAAELLGAAILFGASEPLEAAEPFAGAFPPDPSLVELGGFEGLLQANSINDNATARKDPNPRTRIISSALEFRL
jgi:hypothetical protein